MERGQKVEVTEYGGRRLIRRVVTDKGAIVVVCSEAEYQDAMREKREPESIGFPRHAVLPLPCHGEGILA
jgi:hypothetical protein